jgi:protein TonB
MIGTAAKPLLVFVAVLSTSGLAVVYSQEQTSPAQPPQGQVQPALPKRVRVSSGVIAGMLIKRVSPEYPEKARKKRIQGTVFLSEVINTNGDVTDLSVISGDPMLAKAALVAAKQWKYRPYLLQGQPVEVESQIQVNFMLGGN